MKRAGTSRLRKRSAFTLLEVMIAVAIFFMAMFAILSLVSGSLASVRALQKISADPGSLAAELSLTNSLTEGKDNGDFTDMAKKWQDYRWTSETTEAGTNGLFQVHFEITKSGSQRAVESEMDILLFRPNSVRRR